MDGTGLTCVGAVIATAFARADALACLGPLGEGAVSRMRLELAFEGGDLRLELTHLLEQIRDAARGPHRQLSSVTQ